MKKSYNLDPIDTQHILCIYNFVVSCLHLSFSAHLEKNGIYCYKYYEKSYFHVDRCSLYFPNIFQECCNILCFLLLRDNQEILLYYNCTDFGKMSYIEN